LSCFGKRRSSAVEKYKVFVAEGKGQISPWSLLKKQIFLGDENFVEEMEAKIDKDRIYRKFHQVKEGQKQGL
ncbi:MAG: putative transposase, partial [Gammaproteobacteria bacterium]